MPSFVEIEEALVSLIVKVSKSKSGSWTNALRGTVDIDE